MYRCLLLAQSTLDEIAKMPDNGKCICDKMERSLGYRVISKAQHVRLDVGR